MTKAITICQPYAGAIMDGRKRVENRTWPTRYRGELLIHAGKNKEWLKYWNEDREGPFPDPMHFGCVVGVANLVACYSKSALLRHGFEMPKQHQWVLKHLHTEGPYCWILENIQRVKEPIKCSGKQQLWDASHIIASPDWMFAEFEDVEPVVNA